MKQVSIALFILAFITNNVSGQYNNQTLFIGESGSKLLTVLFNNYKPNSVLSYSSARVKMYKEIYNIHDSVYCVYSRHGLYLDPAYPDPIDYLAKGGSNNGINCEHTFPQSKGAEIGNARSDMHHLFPSRAAVNEARSNYPFGEIEDSKTKSWFYLSSELNSKPAALINEYSEGISTTFEPREDHKGNVSRAILYFYTMYDIQADKLFFESMLPTLCEWHINDPVDSLEWSRTNLIANYQENKPNPFVLDCSLPQRTYCANSRLCLPSSSNDFIYSHKVSILPNPFSDQFQINLENDENSINELSIWNCQGLIISTIKLSSNFDKNLLHINIPELPSGSYLLKLKFNDNRVLYKKLIKI